MTIYGAILPGAATIAHSAVLTETLTERAKYKIKVLDWHRSHGNNNSLTARHFGIGRITLYRWLKRFRHYGIIGLNKYSRRPKNVRKPTTAWDAIIRTVQLRKQYPAWSKHKLKVLLEREGLRVSASTVGRMLKRRGLIDRKKSPKKKKGRPASESAFPQRVWNDIRPHEALGQLTPSEYFWRLQTDRLPTKNVIVLQT